MTRPAMGGARVAGRHVQGRRVQDGRGADGSRECSPAWSRRVQGMHCQRAVHVGSACLDNGARACSAVLWAGVAWPTHRTQPTPRPARPPSSQPGGEAPRAHQRTRTSRAQSSRRSRAWYTGRASAACDAAAPASVGRPSKYTLDTTCDAARPPARRPSGLLMSPWGTAAEAARRRGSGQAGRA
jgi:hypothetical protein